MATNNEFSNNANANQSEINAVLSNHSLKTRIKCFAGQTCETVKQKIEDVLSRPELQTGLDSIFAGLEPIKPFTTTRLLRNLIDAPTVEHFCFSVFSLLEIHGEWLPAKESISIEALTEAWTFFKWVRRRRNNDQPNSQPDNDTVELQPEAFVKVDNEVTPTLTRLCQSMGLDVNEQVGLFQKLEIPLMVLSGLLGILGIFCGDKLISLVFTPKSVASSLSRTAHMIKDLHTSWTFLEKEIEIFMDFIAGFFGMQYISDKNLSAKRAMETIIQLRDEFTIIRENIKSDLTSIVQSETGVNQLEAKILKLEHDIDAMFKQGINVSSHNSFLSQFQKQIRETRETINDCKSSVAGKQHPVLIYLSGESGLGKSTLALELVKELSEREGRPLSVYVRNSAKDKYWSGYIHQDVVIYDDFGQDRENIDHIELIGIFTKASYRLNLADTSDKGRPFTSRYVICCSNQTYINTSKAVNDLEAIHRRRHWLYLVTAPTITQYKMQHGGLPPKGDPLWRQDFGHLELYRYRTLPPDEEADRNIPIEQEHNWRNLATLMYNMQVQMKEEYDTDIRTAQTTREQFIERRRTQEIAEANLQLPPPAQIVEVVEGDRDEFNLGLQQQDEFIQAPEVPLMAEESVHTAVEGCNMYLLLGPSGCGKSALLEKNEFLKIHNLRDIIDGDNSLKIPIKANLHMEDISITVARTNDAIEVCQFLSDNKVFEGNIVFTANPTMLLKNLAARGVEAQELMYRRCRVVTIHMRWNVATSIKRMNATKLRDQSDYTWDDLYYVAFDNKYYNLGELEIILLTNERTIITYAILDQAAVDDFAGQTPVVLDLPTLSFDEFANMEDRAQMSQHLTSLSVLKAMTSLTGYIPAFSRLPRMHCSPAHLINTINREQMRLPEKLPSCKLVCKDFTLCLINHQTYFLAFLEAPEIRIPEFEFKTPEPIVSTARVNYMSLLKQFVCLIGGGIMITRELFGYNQGTKPKAQPESTDSEDEDIEETPKVTLEINEPESRKTTQRKKNHKVARSQRLNVKKEDPSPGAAYRKNQQGTLQNESRRVKYDLNPKNEAKAKTFTDLGPRQELPEFKNMYDVNPKCKYHPNNFMHIWDHYKANAKMITLCQEFDVHIEVNHLDPTFYYNDLFYEGLDPEKREFFVNFINQWKEEFMQAESMSDQQAAQLIPIIEKNQVFVYNGSTLTQRALMVNGRIGVTVAHGLEPHCTVVIPTKNVHYGITILTSRHDRDLAIFELDKTAPSFKDIRKFIKSINDTDDLTGNDACFVTIHKRSDNVLISQIRATRIESRKEVKYDQRKIFGYYYAGTVTGYTLPLPSLTEKGYCGSPAIVLNSRYPRKIISIHSAGADYNAFGLPIFQEMFDTKMEKECVPVPQTPIVVKPYNELTEIKPFKIDEFTVRYELNHNNSAPTKTDLFRSPLQSDMFGDNFEPAILANYDSRNVDHVDIQHVTIEKWSHKQPENIDEDLLKYCAESWGDYFADIFKKNHRKQFVLTKTEAINRTTRYDSSQPINKDTSCGYPWKHRPGSVGKKLYIQPRQHKTAVLNCFTDDVNGRDINHAVDQLIQTCKEGKRPAVVFSSSAKDEVIKKSKIYPCRTRGFTGSPLEYYIAMRQYFHTAICGLIDTRSETPIKLGIEANGQEWDKLYQWLASNSTVGFDLDFKDWDAMIAAVVMRVLPIIYNKIYSKNSDLDPNDLETQNRIRIWLYSALDGPLLTLGQYVVQAPGGQVSGQPNTTPDNCFIHLIFLLYAWMKLAPPHLRTFAAFLEYVVAAVFGDDGVVSVKPEVLGWYNFETVKEILEHDFNVSITSAAKTGKTEKFKPIDEFEFLKRTFLKIGPYRFGKINDSVMDKMLNWTHTCKKHHYFKEPNRVHYDLSTIESSIESMIYELCIFPPEKYQQVVDHVQPILYKLGSRKRIPNQRDALVQRGVPQLDFLSQFKQ